MGSRWPPGHLEPVFALYSYRKACVGAILHARRAGTYAASIATTNNDGTTIK